MTDLIGIEELQFGIGAFGEYARLAAGTVRADRLSQQHLPRKTGVGDQVGDVRQLLVGRRLAEQGDVTRPHAGVGQQRKVLVRVPVDDDAEVSPPRSVPQEHETLVGRQVHHRQ